MCWTELPLRTAQKQSRRSLALLWTTCRRASGAGNSEINTPKPEYIRYLFPAIPLSLHQRHRGSDSVLHIKPSTEGSRGTKRRSLKVSEFFADRRGLSPIKDLSLLGYLYFAQYLFRVVLINEPSIYTI